MNKCGLRDVENPTHSLHSRLIAICLPYLQRSHNLRIGRDQIDPVGEDRVVSDDLPRKLRVSPPRRGLVVVHVPPLDFV